MKKLFAFFRFLTFRWKKIYRLNIPTNEFLQDLNKSQRRVRNIEGKINTKRIDIFYLSDFALMLPAKLPLLQVKGKPVSEGYKSAIIIRVSVIPAILAVFAIAVLIVAAFAIFDKEAVVFGLEKRFYFPLLFALFIYVFLLIIFIIESVNCKDDFSHYIKQIENKRGSQYA